MAKARILAVDDQRYFRVFLEDLLVQQGFEVHTAGSGEEALHLLERESVRRRRHRPGDARALGRGTRRAREGALRPSRT